MNPMLQPDQQHEAAVSWGEQLSMASLPKDVCCGAHQPHTCLEPRLNKYVHTAPVLLIDFYLLSKPFEDTQTLCLS